MLLVFSLLALQAGFADPASDAFDRGVKLSTQGQMEEAIQAYDEAIRLKPDYADAYVKRGEAWRDRNEENEHAIADFTEALKYKPGDPQILLDRADMYERFDKVDQATADVVAAEHADARSANVCVECAMFYWRQGKTEQAVDNFDAALKLDSGNHVAMLYRGYTLDFMGK